LIFDKLATYNQINGESSNMGIENVICPSCGEATYGNVPAGTRLIKVELKRDRFISSEADQSQNYCKNCGSYFYTITTKQKR
jgi:hypothetical protein